jgi:hypothetical protein
MDNLLPISDEELESLKKQIRELEKTLKVLKQRLEFYEQQKPEPRIYQIGMISPADLEQSETTIINLRQTSNSTTINTTQGF